MVNDQFIGYVEGYVTEADTGPRGYPLTPEAIEKYAEDLANNPQKRSVFLQNDTQPMGYIADFHIETQGESNAVVVSTEGSVGFGGQYGGDIHEISSSGSSLEIDWNNGNIQHITLDDDCNLSFKNGLSGRTYKLIIKYAGAYSITWPGDARWSGGTAPTQTSTNGKTDYIGFIYNSVDSTYDGVSQRTNF